MGSEQNSVRSYKGLETLSQQSVWRWWVNFDVWLNIKFAISPSKKKNALHWVQYALHCIIFEKYIFQPLSSPLC